MSKSNISEPEDQEPENDDQGEESTDLQSLDDVLNWVKSLTAIGVTPDAALAATSQIMISKMGNEQQSELADKAAENAAMNSDTAHQQGKETAEISHKHAMELVKAKPSPTSKQ